MKKLIALTLAVAALAFGATAQTTSTSSPVPTVTVPSAPLLPNLGTNGQTVQSILANVPTVPLAQEKFGLTVGTVISGASTVKQVNLLDYSIGSTFFVGAELINSAQAGSVLESAGVRAGIYHSLTTARIYGYLEGRRNWSIGAWEGKAGAGIAYTPFQSQTNSFVQNFSAVADFGLVVNQLKNAPPEEEIVGVRYSF